MCLWSKSYVPSLPPTHWCSSRLWLPSPADKIQKPLMKTLSIHPHTDLNMTLTVLICFNWQLFFSRTHCNWQLNFFSSDASFALLQGTLVLCFSESDHRHPSRFRNDIGQPQNIMDEGTGVQTRFKQPWSCPCNSLQAPSWNIYFVFLH